MLDQLVITPEIQRRMQQQIDSTAPGSLADHIGHKTMWRIDKHTFVNGKKLLYQINEFPGNMGLNGGLAVLISRLTGGTAATGFGTQSMMGVGNGTAAAAPAQTGLQGASKFYKAMESTSYPSVNGQAVSWKADFATNEANFDWEEMTVSNNTDDTGDNLVRKVSSQGTKVSGEQWDLTLVVTFS